MPNGRPVRCFTRREIEKLLYRAGFTVNEFSPKENEALQFWRREGCQADLRAGRWPIAAQSANEAEEFLTEWYQVVAMRRERRNYDLTSIIIPTYNQLVYTQMCLESIRARTDEPHELIVVDNGSTDGTVDYLRCCADVKLIENSENRGFPGACNQGIMASRGNQVMLLNNDVLVTTGWLTRLLDALYRDHEAGVQLRRHEARQQANARVGLVGPCSNAVSGPQQIDVGYDDLANLDGWAWEWGKQNDGRQMEVDRLVGFCFLFRRELIEKVGVLDEQFGIGNFEDDDFCLRAAEAGYRSAIARDAFIHHFGHRTFDSSGIDLNTLLQRNHELFARKWEGRKVPSIVDREASRRPSPSVTGDGAVEKSTGDREKTTGHALVSVNAQPLLSCCMIVKDNERTIAAAVESMKPWADEIIVVDTGSTDATPEICRRLGCRVYHFPWPDSFSVARNESLKYARGAWIIWIDSDDVIDAANGRNVRELLKRPIDANILGLTMRVRCPAAGADGDFDFGVVDHCKIFRNRPDIRFEGRIHEQVLGAISRAGGEVAYTPYFVVHAGADHSPSGRRRKLARDYRLLRLELRDQPGQTFALFNLGMTFADEKKHHKAVRALERSLAAARPNDTHLRKIYALLASSLKELGRTDEALHYCREGLALFPKDPELHFRSGLLLYDAGRLRDAEKEYRAALADNDERHFASLDSGITGYKTRQNLAAVYSDMGALHRAEEQWRMIVKEVPRYCYAWQALADNLLEQRKFDAAAQLADGLFAVPALRSISLTMSGLLAERRGDMPLARQFLVEAVEQRGDDERPLEELARVLFHHGRPEEAEAALTRLVRDKPTDASAQHNLAIVYLRQGRIVEATLMARSSLQLRPESAATRQLLECAEAAVSRGGI
jgi:GT2 family glycosyltransferase/tetratricopeptide (TPR) repeat protein